MILLDGGMGRELHRTGAPFRQPEWSALALMEAPHCVEDVHVSFIQAGADIITTNSYSIVPFHLGTETYENRAAELLDLSAQVAVAARAKAGQKPVLIAGSIPPVCGSYAPQNFKRETAEPILTLFCQMLAPKCDLLLLETHASWAELELSLEVASNHHGTVWPSLTLEDNAPTQGTPKLRSGETVAEVAEKILNRFPSTPAMLFNCSQPEVMQDAVEVARGIAPPHLQIGVYANGFPAKDPRTSKANEDHSEIRADLTPQRYAEFALNWQSAGADIIGGCCGIGPEHIHLLKERLYE